MPTIKKDLALTKLSEAIRHLPPDDITDIYNELFPENPCEAALVKADSERFQKQIFDYFDIGLEVEEILALWRIVFPLDRRVYFNEETDELVFQNKEFLYAE